MAKTEKENPYPFWQGAPETPIDMKLVMQGKSTTSPAVKETVVTELLKGGYSEKMISALVDGVHRSEHTIKKS